MSTLILCDALRGRTPRDRAGTPAGCRRAGFTLVELLVVIGIIALLVAILMPALSRARAQAYQVVCLSNLRQVGGAVLAYANVNKGMFPAPALASCPQPEDWVHWEPTRDPMQGAIVPYLGPDLRVLVCPMGIPDRPPNVRLGYPGHPVDPPYPYSYSVSRRMTGYSYIRPFNPKISGEEFGRLGRIVNPSQKVLAIEEDTTGISDGTWWADTSDRDTGRFSSGSVRHDGSGPEYVGDPMTEYAVFAHPKVKNRRCNVFFADGHVGTLLRWQLEYSCYSRPLSREGPK